MHALALYLSMVLASIAPHVEQGRREAIAQDVAAATLSETRAFEDDANGQKTALLLLSIAHYETGKSWASWIDDGRCNDPAWRARHAAWLRGGDCDGGHAYSMWQVHVPRALGRALSADRQEAARTALRYARASLKLGVGLCAYSGEHYPHCRLAARRLETAHAWALQFPYPSENRSQASR